MRFFKLANNSTIDAAEWRKLSFWLSQAIMVVATILGVYLAAQEGFKQAVAYEQLMDTKANYYLRQSLRSELANNVNNSRQWLSDIKKVPAARLRSAPLELDLFVWEAMAASPNTLATPSQFLTKTQFFYKELNKIESSLVRQDYDWYYANEKLTTLTKTIEEELLPALDADLNLLHKHLIAQGITLDR